MEAAGIKKGDVGGVLQLDSVVGCSKDRFMMGRSSRCAARSREPSNGAGFDRRCCIAGESAGGGSHGALLRREVDAAQRRAMEMAARARKVARAREAAQHKYPAFMGARETAGRGAHAKAREAAMARSLVADSSLLGQMGLAGPPWLDQDRLGRAFGLGPVGKEL
jgi:hypothetical protein